MRHGCVVHMRHPCQSCETFADCSFRRLVLVVFLSLWTNCLPAGPLQDVIKERRVERMRDALSDEMDSGSTRSLPVGVIMKGDLAYGDDPSQRLDVYLRGDAKTPMPIIFMVHGGAWKYGDKRMGTVIENKIQRWVPKGFIFVSVNNRLLPAANPFEQAEDVARALAYVQQHATEFHGDPDRVILMGHSAGAHLVSLVATHPNLAVKQGVKPWLGTVSLDSAAYDITEIMQHRHYKFYDEAFGKDPAFWKKTSPSLTMVDPLAPLLAVCSSRRDDSIPQAKQFAARAKQSGSSVTVLSEDLSHKEINQKLGEPGTYTEAVEAFLRKLDAQIAARLEVAR